MLYEKLDGCQKTAVRKAIRLKSVCVFFEQGVGKTHPTVALVEELLDEDFIGFIVCRLSNLSSTWLKLLKSTMPQLNIAHEWQEFKDLPRPKLLLVNYEAFRKIGNKFLRPKWKLGVFDESQDLKARGSKQSRLAGRIKECEYRICLSGTPIDDSPIDLYAQLRFVAPQLYGNDKSAWTRFDEQYLKETGYMGYQRKFRKEMLPVFLDEIKPYIIRVEAEDVLTLPTCHEKMIAVHMDGKQDKAYRDMERDFVAKILKEAEKKAAQGKTVRVSAGLKITQMIKLQQLCGGFVIEDEGETIELPSVKLDRTEVLITSGRAKLPVVIFCKYKNELLNIQQMLDRLGLKHAAIHGKIKDKKKNKLRTKTIEAFQSNKLDALVCQIRAGGVGVDLYKGRSAIFYSTSFSFIDYDQCRKRLHRRGQVNEVTLFFLYVKDSIDEDIYSAILSKRSVSKSIFNKMKLRSFKNGYRVKTKSIK